MPSFHRSVTKRRKSRVEHSFFPFEVAKKLFSLVLDIFSIVRDRCLILIASTILVDINKRSSTLLFILCRLCPLRRKQTKKLRWVHCILLLWQSIKPESVGITTNFSKYTIILEAATLFLNFINITTTFNTDFSDDIMYVVGTRKKERTVARTIFEKI